MDFPFKGDETPLRHMEHAELITIGTLDGRIRRHSSIFRRAHE